MIQTDIRVATVDESSRTVRAQRDPTRIFGPSRCSQTVDNLNVPTIVWGRCVEVPKGVQDAYLEQETGEKAGLVRGTILNRTYGTDKNQLISIFFLTTFGPIYYGPQ